jgi:hypothetical protein
MVGNLILGNHRRVEQVVAIDDLIGIAIILNHTNDVGDIVEDSVVEIMVHLLTAAAAASTEMRNVTSAAPVEPCG